MPPRPQSYASHAYHPVPSYIAGGLWLASAIAFIGTILLDWDARDVAIGWLLACVTVLISIGRVYTTRLQDRIIRLEMKVRCVEILGADAARMLAQLSPKQIAALRFASDAELGALLDRAVRERLSPRAIKQAITSWVPDTLRT